MVKHEVERCGVSEGKPIGPIVGEYLCARAVLNGEERSEEFEPLFVRG